MCVTSHESFSTSRSSPLSYSYLLSLQCLFFTKLLYISRIKTLTQDLDFDKSLVNAQISTFSASDLKIRKENT